MLSSVFVFGVRKFKHPSSLTSKTSLYILKKEIPIKTKKNLIKKEVSCHVFYKALLITLFICKKYGNAISANETCFIMHKCLELYSQINPFVILKLLNFIHTSVFKQGIMHPFKWMLHQIWYILHHQLPHSKHKWFYYQVVIPYCK